MGLVVEQYENKEFKNSSGGDLNDDIEREINRINKSIYPKYEILQKHIDNEFKQEGAIRPDNGGEDTQAKKEINKLIKDAKLEFGSRLDGKGIISGYRSYKTQADLNIRDIPKKGGVEQEQKSRTLPGFSEHHTGKCFDIFSVETGWWNRNSDIKNWVAENAGKYGFRVTYQKQGVLRMAEPWHLYYIGGGSSTSTSNEKISDEKVDAYFASSSIDEKLEKNIEKQYAKSNCKKVNNFTKSPTFQEVKEGNITIRIGHEGSEVEKIQKKLTDLGYDLGKCGVDGLFGVKTKKAIEEFQKKNGLTISSSVDSETLKKLATTNSETQDSEIYKDTDPQRKTKENIQGPSDSFVEYDANGEQVDFGAIAASGAGGRRSLKLKMGFGKGNTLNESQIKKYYELKNSSSIEWVVANCSKGQIIANSSNASENIYGASVPKIVIAAAALHNNGGTVPGNVLGSKDKEWNGIINLLVKSENDPAWSNTQKIAGGEDGVMKFVQQMGYKGMIPTRRPAMINAMDMANFYIDLTQGNFNGASSIQKLSNASQTSNSRSKVYLPSNVQMGGKTGTWSGFNHDTGWIYYEGQYWSIVVLTKGKTSNDVAIMWGGLFNEYIQK